MAEPTKARVPCRHCGGTGTVPVIIQCPECGAHTYERDFGCTSCGLGNPFRGIGCLTPVVGRQVLAEAREKEAGRG